MNPPKSHSATWALLLIAVALAGAGVSYHFTLQSRFASIEQKLDQDSLALQQFQVAQENTASSKLDALNTLSKEVDALQTSLEPLGKATHDHSDSLSQIHQQIAALEQSQQAQQDAQKKLADYALQLDKLKHEIQTAQVQPPSVSVTSAPAALPVPADILTPRTTTPNVILPLPPRADNAVDLRPDQSTVTTEDASVRALPVALPVALSSTGGR
jgi:hypothetical protein